MWVYFDKNGVVKEILEYGNPARAGTTNFEIFAYFDRNPQDKYFPVASVKLYKPDFYGTAYPSLLMTEETFVFKPDSETEQPKFFKNGEEYTGFYFDFGKFVENEEVTVLLDTPGIWRAIITLFGDNYRNVIGEIAFNVQPGISTSDESNVSIDQVIDLIYDALAKQNNIRINEKARTIVIK